MPTRPALTRATRHQRPLGARARLIVLAIYFAGWAALGSGCLVTPRQAPNSAPTSPPQIPEGANAEVAAGLQQSGPRTDFRAEATDRQAFQVHIDFGRVFESQGNFDGAMLEYQEALTAVETRRRGSLGPADAALAHRRMGGALDRLGRFAQAEAHYQKSLKLSPRDSKIWNDVGYSYYLQGRWADAERALKTAAKLAPEDERIRINLGLTLAAAGKTTEALPLLSQTTGDAAGHANLGYLLAATGQFDLARQQYEIALAQRPDMELARRALARLDRQQQNLAAPDGTGGSLAASKRVAAGRLDRGVEPAAVTTATIPPAPNPGVQPATVTAAAISPPRNLLVEPAAASKATIPPARNLQVEPTAVLTAKIPPSRNLQVEPAAVLTAKIPPPRNLLVEPAAPTKATIPPPRNLQVERAAVTTATIPPPRSLQAERAAVTTATIPPPRNLHVEPAAGSKATIPPPRNWSVPPASRAPAALVNPSGVQPGRTDVINVSNPPLVPDI
jgi:Flp pilus assembly protein TadD